jgi:hypothetical protein
VTKALEKLPEKVRENMKRHAFYYTLLKHKDATGYFTINLSSFPRDYTIVYSKNVKVYSGFTYNAIIIISHINK